MQKLNLKKHRAFFCVAFAVTAAAVLRQIGFQVEAPFNWLFSFFRSVIYIMLFAAWGISVCRRIIQPQVRRYLNAISALMVFWVTARTLRHLFAETPWALRHLWYLYYLPMLFIPLLALFVALSLGKPDNFRLPKWTALLYIPTAALLLLVLTNDLHQLVFRFPEDAVVWMNEYRYGIVYFPVVGWMVLCALTALVIMLVKCRVPNSRKVLVLPFVPVVLSVIYGALYIFQLPWLRLIAGDVTVVFCLLIAATLESCIQCGLIQSNTHYRELFDASTVGAQITDPEYHVVLSSRAAQEVNIETLRQTQQAPVMLEGGIRLSGAPIKNGYVIWTEDVSPLIRVLNDLEEAKENLQDNKDILEEEHAVKEREAHIAEQERLYHIIQRDTAKQILLMDEMIEQAENAGSDEERRHILKKMLVIGAYLKRRSNLVFLSDKDSMLEATELELSIGESINNLETFGVTCGFISELTGLILSMNVIAMYDFFEEIAERSLDRMSSILVHAGIKAGFLVFSLDTDSRSDFSDLASDAVTAVQDEDGEWKLTLRLDMGGGRQ
ncbi:MAG: histidine kinase N-terminal 7TM domain-containing protein [Oscillospiraceae bacterium]|jgi:hypothetical protein|nr:histidine kinase N-terminal 7TM domain-containing protein [Oscillospiraceae bacterium]